MDVRNCRKCGKMFNYIGKPMCPNCMQELEETFEQVRQYVQDNPTANITQVADENNVSVNQIRTWIKQERLSFSDASLVGMACEKCGALIKTGRFCDDCKQKMGNAFESTIKAPDVEIIKKKKEAARMHFLDSNN